MFIEIDAAITSKDLTNILQRELRDGELLVTREGTCAGYKWNIEWTEVGGNKPQFVADGTSLTGDNVTISVDTVTDGGLLLGPIPAEFLRTPEPKPQVSF